MNKKSQDLIKTEEFIKKFPKKAKELNSEYILSFSPKISYRTLRYYFTNNLMPKPRNQNNKSYYLDTDYMYKRLYFILYLIHYSRLGFENTKRLLSIINREYELDLLYVLLGNKKMLLQISSVKNIKEIVRKFSAFLNEDLEVMQCLIKICLKESEKLIGIYLPLSKHEKQMKLYKVQERIDYFKQLQEEIPKILDNLNEAKNRISVYCPPRNLLNTP